MAFKGITAKKRWEHTWYECDCGEGSCLSCGGGLSSCTVCNGAEGTLTTDCCERKLTEEEEFKIYREGTLDFIEGSWIELSDKARIEFRLHTIYGRQLATLRKEVKDMEYKTVALLGRVADMEKHKVAVVDKVLRALYQKGEE